MLEYFPNTNVYAVVTNCEQCEQLSNYNQVLNNENGHKIVNHEPTMMLKYSKWCTVGASLLRTILTNVSFVPLTII